MSSREQPIRLNFTNTRRRGGRLKPDYGNRFYLFGSRGWGGGSATRPANNFPSEPDLKEGLDTTTIIQTISAPAHPMVPEYFPIDNVKYVASYNWTAAEKPTIVVPGSPAIWTGRAVPFTLQPDEGYVWKNVQLSQYPILPLFAAADAIHDQEAAPPVDWPTVDFVTDHNDLRKLLRWLSPSPGREVQDFRIDVQLVGTKTLVLRRWESAHTGTTQTGHCPSSRHHRVIAYNMLNTKMVVRFGIDACLPSPGSSVATTYFDDSNLAPCAPSGMNAEQASTSATTTISPAIDIVRAGMQVPQNALVEVVSPSAYYLDRLDWNELYSQLALSQTPTLRMGVHERGEFKELREWQLEGSGTRLGTTSTSGQSETQKGADVQDLSAQRRETAVQIVRLERVLQDVQKVAIARGSGPAGSFSLVCEGGKLCVYARKMDSDGDRTSSSGNCLPPDVAARFETQMHGIL
ncbi:hypothetical protein EDB86DRAFT_3206213 [Lactarius hatsudake]|nr:hypothetical protein EDB86DRAFT_3206213 [Lactarius hatsudake]